QKPVKQHKLLVTISCAIGCRAGAFALLKIGSGKPFEVDSHVTTLSANASKTLSIAFGSGTLSRLRSALRHHRRILAEVAGVVLDPANKVRTQTPPRFLTIKGS